MIIDHLEFNRDSLKLIKDLNLNNNKVYRLVSPENETDAANISYVDCCINTMNTTTSSVLPSTHIQFSNNLVAILTVLSMSDKLISNVSIPTNNKDAANRQHADTKIEKVLLLLTVNMRN